MAKIIHLSLGSSKRATDCKKMIEELYKKEDKNLNVYLMGLIEQQYKIEFGNTKLQAIKDGG